MSQWLPHQSGVNVNNWNAALFLITLKSTYIFSHITKWQPVHLSNQMNGIDDQTFEVSINLKTSLDGTYQLVDHSELSLMFSNCICCKSPWMFQPPHISTNNFIKCLDFFRPFCLHQYCVWIFQYFKCRLLCNFFWQPILCTSIWRHSY